MTQPCRKATVLPLKVKDGVETNKDALALAAVLWAGHADCNEDTYPDTKPTCTNLYRGRLMAPAGCAAS